MKMSRHHRNVLIQNLQAQDVEELIHRPVMCAEKYHEKEQLEYYCQECKVCICHKCGLVKHDRHAKVDIQQAAEEQKMQIMDVLEKAKAELAVRVEEMKRGSELLEKSKEEIVAAQNKVRATVEEFVQLLREHETAMISELNKMYDTQQKAHATQHKNFELLTTQLRSSVEYGESIIQRNIGPEILHAQYHVVGRLEELLNAEKTEIHRLPHIDYVTNENNVQKVRRLVPGQVVCSYTNPSRSVAEGRGLQAAEVGGETQFIVLTKDSEGKLFYCKDDQLTVTIQTPTGKELKKKIEGHNDGKYAITYTAESAGQHDVVITVNGQPLPGSPWSVDVTSHQYKTLFTFGSYGKGQGQLESPEGIAVSEKTGNNAVADFNNKRIQMFSSERGYLREFGQKGPGAERLGLARSVAFTRSGDVVVGHGGDGQPYKISVFAENGQFIKHITNEHLKNPWSVSVGRDGHLIVCDCGDNTIKVLSPDGTELLQSFSAPGCNKSPFFPVYHQDKYYVSYHWANCVKVFNMKGAFLYNIGSEGSGDGQLYGPIGLAVDKFNNLIVCDQDNNRLQVFTLDGKSVIKIKKQLAGLGRPRCVAVSNDGHLFVTDDEKNSVHIFQ